MRPYIDIRKELDIADETWDGWVWRNYKGFRDNLNAWKAERLLDIAQANIAELLCSTDERIKNDITKFVAETAGKKTYSKRTEQTGADGKDLLPTMSDAELNRRIAVAAAAIGQGGISGLIGGEGQTKEGESA